MSDERVVDTIRCPRTRCRGQAVAVLRATTAGLVLDVIGARVGYLEQIRGTLAAMRRRGGVGSTYAALVQPGGPMFVHARRVRVIDADPADEWDEPGELWRGRERAVACPRCHTPYRVVHRGGGSVVLTS